MFKIKYIAIFSLLFVSALAPLDTARAQSPIPPTVLEIFTSKYCPACPGGDRNFISAINNNPNIIGLSCHVTYFDRDARRDELSKPFCNARQNIYKLALKTGKIYTPMMVVNGQQVTTGLKSRELSRALQTATKPQKNIDLQINGKYLDIRLPQITLEKDVEIWLFEIDNKINRDGYSHYQNTVTNITRLMTWNGRSVNMAYPLEKTENLSYAVIAQSYKGGIIAAGKTAD